MTGPDPADPANRIARELHEQHQADGLCPDWCPLTDITDDQSD